MSMGMENSMMRFQGGPWVMSFAENKLFKLTQIVLLISVVCYAIFYSKSRKKAICTEKCSILHKTAGKKLDRALS